MSALVNQSIPVGFVREEPNKQISLVFDCAGSGVKNIDLDNMQFMINAFKDDYPWCLNYILVYEMPWVMNGEPSRIHAHPKPRSSMNVAT